MRGLGHAAPAFLLAGRLDGERARQVAEPDIHVVDKPLNGDELKRRIRDALAAAKD
jgi:hypothetical protein